MDGAEIMWSLLSNVKTSECYWYAVWLFFEV